ncbi:MAG: putative toxin-antitoxin system toxin component, PIN family [Betaproteobacteria bacterium]
MRVFLDTNVLVAAFATRGLCADVFRLAAVERELLIGEPVLIELERVLEKKLRMPHANRSPVLQALRRFALVPAAKTPVELGIGDRDDDWILACALLARADMFVTGDHALLGLGSVGGLHLLSPREFWTRRFQS